MHCGCILKLFVLKPFILGIIKIIATVLRRAGFVGCCTPGL